MDQPADNNNTFVIRGREGTGLFPRYEIRDLQKDKPEQFTLFVLGCLAVQYPDGEIPFMPKSFKPRSVVPDAANWFNAASTASHMSAGGVSAPMMPSETVIFGCSGDPYDDQLFDGPAGGQGGQQGGQGGQQGGQGGQQGGQGGPQGGQGGPPKPLQSGGGFAQDLGGGMVGVGFGMFSGASEAASTVAESVTTAAGQEAGVAAAAAETLVQVPLNLMNVGATKKPEVQTKPTVPPDTWRFGGYCAHACRYSPQGITPVDQTCQPFSFHHGTAPTSCQSLGLAATAIANQVTKNMQATQAQKWKKAAEELRFPFWDWTLDDVATDGLPNLLRTETVPVLSPTGAMTNIKNPMATFHFAQPLHPQFKNVDTDVRFSGDPPTKQMAYFSTWKRTLRWPASAADTDDYTRLNYHLKRLHADMKSKVAHLFTYDEDLDEKTWSHKWDEFSNTTVQSDPAAAQDVSIGAKSLEGVHNSMHIIIGGIGHMGQNEYAGFEPIFWLHHVNVDRLFALWEYCYPRYFVGAGYWSKENGHDPAQPRGTYYQLDHTRLDQYTDMLPFRRTRDAYWTAQDARSLENRPDVYPKWYTYPPVAGVQVDKPAPEAERIKYRAALQKYFGLHGHVKTAHRQTKNHSSPLFKNPIADVLIPKHLSALNNYRHFVLKVSVNEAAFGDSYTFELSYKPQDGSNEEKFSHVAVLTRPKDTQCAGCQGRNGVNNVVKGMIHIPSHHVTKMLSAVASMDVESLKDMLENDEASKLKGSLTASLVGCGGHVFATATCNPVDDHDRLPADVTPECKLLTAYAGLHKLHGDDGPFSFFGWKDHGEVFQNTWKKGAA